MEMQQIWEKYVLENSLDSFIIDKTIIDSWQLSKKFKVNPKDGIGKRFLTTSDFQKRLRDHETMVSLAKKSLNRFQFLLKNIDFILVLTDADGYILWQSGNEHLKEHAREIRFSQGYQWTESMVGTNSIGIALRTKEANFIHGYEHFARASHNWSCVASPVFGENREVVGVVDLSMPAHYPKKEDFLFTVQLIAEFISEALQRKVFEEQKYMLQYFSSKKQPGILCNSSMTILHISPELVDEPEAYIGKKLSALPNEKWEIVKRDPIRKEDTCIGYFVYVKHRIFNHPFKFHQKSARIPQLQSCVGRQPNDKLGRNCRQILSYLKPTPCLLLSLF